MKKILSILVVFAMVFTVIPVALAEMPSCCIDDYNEAYDADMPATEIADIGTTAIIAGTGGNPPGGDGNTAPVIKCKWEYDLDVVIDIEECDNLPCDCSDGYDEWWHDACPFTDGLQVKPILGGSVRVGYYAVVTDAQGVGTVSAVYADVWHPDYTFKYQIELLPISSLGETMEIWSHVEECHSDLIKINDVWECGLGGDVTAFEDIWHELNQGLAKIYYGEALISYCQPGGWYYVGVRGHDNYGAWSSYLFNRFWYIPTAAVALDFTTVDYGTLTVDPNNFYPAKWVGGDTIFGTSEFPTVRNLGNTVVGLFVWQDDMGFGTTNDQYGAPYWNVYFDARLGPPEGNAVIEYDPYETCDVRIPGVLPLCDKEKLDFSIHVTKGFPTTEPYTGAMRIFAKIEGYGITPFEFWGEPIHGVDEIYDGPTLPGPVNGCDDE